MKTLIKKALYNPHINSAVRTVLRPFVNDTIVDLVPVIGQFEVKVPNSRPIKLLTRERNYLCSKLYWHGVAGWEPYTVEIMQRMLNPNRVALDIGANIGVYSVLMGRQAKHVVGFEPMRAAAAMALHNVFLNDLSNVNILPYAVSEKVGYTYLHVPLDSDNAPVNASVENVATGNFTHIEVPMTTIDQSIDRDDGRVGIIKIDVEGHEDAVLRGALLLIQRDRPRIICEILNDDMAHKIEEIMLPLGYKFAWIGRNNLYPQAHIRPFPETGCYNHLLSPNEIK